MRRCLVVVFGCSLLLSSSLSAAEMHPVETQLRTTFRSLALDSNATFESAGEVVNGRVVSGLRARFSQPAATDLLSSAIHAPRTVSTSTKSTLSVTYPRAYDDAILVQMGSQRVALRPVGASSAFATPSGGKLVYERPYPSTDTIEIPSFGRSEELLLLHDRRAPLVYDYEIVESEGVAGVVLQGGAIRFLPQVTSTDIATAGFSKIPASLQIDKPWIIDAMGRRSESLAHWTLIGDGAIPKIIRLTLRGVDALSYPLVVDPSFSSTGKLATARQYHTATLLPTGKVLITGGSDGSSSYYASAELYDPSTGTFSPTPNLSTRRAAHNAILLPNGRVLVTGGSDGSAFLSSAEVYDPVAGTFSATGSMTSPRAFHSATLLLNGKVLIAGGQAPGNLSSAELYDPAAGTFTATGSMATSRYAVAAALLQNGKVLVAGGNGSSGSLGSAELYDPAAGTFSVTGSMSTARGVTSGTVLPNGKVLIAGGNGSVTSLVTAELYDPAAGTFSATGSMSEARTQVATTLLPNGKVLVAGGANFTASSTVYSASAELYDPVAGTFSFAGTLSTPRALSTATLLPSGNVLIAGGYNDVALAPAEIYDSAAGSFSASGSLATPRIFASATLLPNGQVLILGGVNGGALASAELYDPATGNCSATGSMTTPRTSFTVTLLATGKVLVAGGSNTSPSLGSAEIYDPNTGIFSPTGNLIFTRATHTATLLPDGRVLMAGGADQFAASISSTELYDPASGTFSATGSMATARRLHSATLLPNGKVLVAGGLNATADLLSAELYDPITATFSSTGNMTARRDSAVTTLLPNGTVLIAGGVHASTILTSAELYDPAAGTFSVTGSMSTAHNGAAAALLPNGKFLMAGGYNGTFVASSEIYDPATGTFGATANLPAARSYPAAALLPSGKVFIAGGGNPTFLSSSVLYDPGTGFDDLRQPLISSWPFSGQTEPATMPLSGNHFRGDSQASTGNVNSSPTNYPILQLQRIDNDQVFFIPASASWSDISFTSAILSGLPNGYYRTTIVTNGVPSVQRLIAISYPAPTITNVSPASGPTNGGQSVTITGTNLDNLTNVTFGGTIGGVTIISATGITVTTPPMSAGPVVVAVNTAGGTATSTYTYVFGAPASILASAITATSVGMSWPAVFGATSYDVARSSDGTNYTIITSTNGTVMTDNGVAPNTAYLYRVRASDGVTTTAYTAPDLATTVIFTDPPLLGVKIKAVHMTDLRTAVNAVQVLAGMPPATFTDPTITAGTTLVKAVHVNELRSNLDAARASLGLPVTPYTDPTLTAGTRVKMQHILDLRNRTQ